MDYSDEYTDLDYTVWFARTSSACPQVAAVCALVMSVNPCLTGAEVREIVESTAQKVRPDLYKYKDTIGRPNGTWHREVGYGLVDAYAAVAKAIRMKDTTLTSFLIRDNIDDVGIEPNSHKGVIFNTPDIWCRNQSDGFTVQESENLNPDSIHWVYVKVKNIGNKNYDYNKKTAKVQLYWASKGV